MNFWEHITRRFRAKTNEAELARINAYRAVFMRNPSQSQQQAVLADLGMRCGWNQITQPSDASQAIWFNEGKRAAYAEIFAMLSLSPTDVDALDRAIRVENMNYGDDN